MSQNGKLMPNLDQQSTKLLNLTVLQRIDPFIEQILITAAHVTFYEFDIDHSQWSRKDVEGSLFVVKRNTQPRFQFIVMNRRNTDNLVENLLGDFEYEVQVPYLLYRNAAQEVNGIWFYNARECEEVANLFSRSSGLRTPLLQIDHLEIKILSAYSKVPQKLIPTRKSEFEALEAVPTMAVMDGPLEPSSSTLSSVTDTPDDPSFVNFFSAALTMKNGSNTAISGESFQSAIHFPGASRPVSSPSVMAPSLQVPPAPLLSSTPLPLLEPAKSESSMIRPTNLVKPSSFFTPPSSSAMLAPSDSSSIPTAPPLQPVVPRPYGTPMLQPFPPPAPPPSLTPSCVPNVNYGSGFTRDHVRDALLILVQDNQFIDMIYQALQNAHQSS